MRDGARITVIIPALDEEASIGQVIEAVPAWVDEIIVVDNGSADATGERARAGGATVIREPRRGYGMACQAGIREAAGADVVVFLDADNADRPGEMDRLVDPIVSGVADLVLGSRRLGRAEPRSLSLLQRAGNRLACLLMRWLWGAGYTDLGPFRAIAYHRLIDLGLSDADFGWTIEMQIAALRQRLRTREVPVSYRARSKGSSKISGNWRGSVAAGIKILSVIAATALKAGISR